MATNLDEIERLAKADRRFVLGAVSVLDLIQRLRAAEAAKNEPEETKFGRAIMNRLLTMFPGKTASDIDETIACWYALAAGIEEGIVVAAGAAVRAAEVPQKPNVLADEVSFIAARVSTGCAPHADAPKLREAATALREAEAEIATLKQKCARITSDLINADRANARLTATIERVRAWAYDGDESYDSFDYHRGIDDAKDQVRSALAAPASEAT